MSQEPLRTVTVTRGRAAGALGLRGTAGFSLVDMLIVLMLLGIVAAVAIPGLQGVVLSMRLGQGAREVERELQTARLTAVSGNRSIRVRFNCPEAGTYRMVELLGTPRTPLADDAAADRCGAVTYPYPPADRNPLTVPNLDGPVRWLPQGVTFVAGATLEFWPDGSVHQQSGHENPWLPLGVAGATITLTRGDRARIITVNGLGKIQLQP